jgi:hypothetical protein
LPTVAGREGLDPTHCSRSALADFGQKQPVRCAYETRTDSEVALLAIQYYDREASEACTIVAGQELERFA